MFRTWGWTNLSEVLSSPSHLGAPDSGRRGCCRLSVLPHCGINLSAVKPGFTLYYPREIQKITGVYDVLAVVVV